MRNAFPFTNFGKVTFLMGAPKNEIGWNDDEEMHLRSIPRGFGISARQVTNMDFDKFLTSNPHVRYKRNTRYSVHPSDPVTGVTFFHAMQYCRWLSEVEQIPDSEMCYPEIETISRIASQEVESLKLGNDLLIRQGFRIPTEAEWEYACRAGCERARPFGDGHGLLANYAWYSLNSDDKCHPVCQLLPNEYGLFDFLGNAWEWCHGDVNDLPPRGSKRTVVDDVIISEIMPKQVLILRGGAMDSEHAKLRCARRTGFMANEPYDNNTFRIACTIK
jgi:formylglycine-generating enzyme required for sulfatase activity